MSEPTPPTGGAPAPQTKETPEPVKLTLTQAELDERIEAARVTERTAAQKAKEAADAETQRKADEQKGEWEKLAKQNEAERDAARREARTLKLQTELQSHLLDKHPEYAKSAKYILPLIPADTKDAELAKAIEKAAADFVTDNPRQTERRAGVPSARTDSRTSPTRQPAGGVEGYLSRSYPGPASMRRPTSN